MADEYGYDSKGTLRNITMSKKGSAQNKETMDNIAKMLEEEKKKQEAFYEQQLNDNRGKMKK